MRIIDSSGAHKKWIERSRCWAYSYYYSINIVRYESTSNNGNRRRIFNDIKRK